MTVRVNDDTRVAWTGLGTVKASLPELLNHEDVKIRENAQIIQALVTLLENQRPAINLLQKFTDIIEGCGGWPDTSSSQSALYNLAVEAEQALQGFPALEETVAVPSRFLKGFHQLAHNYSLKAQPPEHYDGRSGDAFSDAYAKCGQELAALRAMIKEN